MEKLVDKRKRGKLASSWSKQSNIDQYEYKYNVQTKRDIEKDVFLIGKVHSKVTEDYRITEVSVFSKPEVLQRNYSTTKKEKISETFLMTARHSRSHIQE